MKSVATPIRIIEVGPRDGLQNEPTPIPTEVKLAFIRALTEAGLREIEATSFVHPGRIPQLADAEAVIAGLPAGSGTRYSALVPNERGLERALASGIPRIAVFTAASETFVQRNIGMTIRQSLDTFRGIAERATAAGLTARGYVSTCFVCPYEGEMAPAQVEPVVRELFDLGVDEVSIGDTVGAAVPTDVERLLAALPDDLPRDQLAMHFHDTSGTALANVLASLEAGITTFDSSAGGLGGCPYAPGAAGNLATEDLVYMLERMGYATGVSLEGIARASALIAGHLPHPLPSRQYARLSGVAGNWQAAAHGGGTRPAV